MHGRSLRVQSSLGALALCFLVGDASPTFGGLGSPRALSRVLTMRGGYLLTPLLKLALLGVRPPAP
jgi:hypothetical protein